MYRDESGSRTRNVLRLMVGKRPGDDEFPSGAALRREWRATSMSLENPSLLSGVQRNFISLIEPGQNPPTIGMIARLARALGMRASELAIEAERELRRRP